MRLKRALAALGFLALAAVALAPAVIEWVMRGAAKDGETWWDW